MRAPLRRRDRMDLIDDDPSHISQRLARLRRQHEVQRLGRRDADVGRPGHQPPPLRRTGVPGAHADRRQMHLDAEALGRQADAAQRCPQVLVDVDRERSQRREVQHPGALSSGGLGFAHDPVDGPQERCEGLARAGGRRDEAVLAGGDGAATRPPGIPSARSERRREPFRGRRRERAQRRMAVAPPGCDVVRGGWCAHSNHRQSKPITHTASAPSGATPP